MQWSVGGYLILQFVWFVLSLIYNVSVCFNAIESVTSFKEYNCFYLYC